MPFNDLASGRGEQDTQNSVLMSPSPHFKYWVFGALAIGIFTSVVDHGTWVEFLTIAQEILILVDTACAKTVAGNQWADAMMQACEAAGVTVTKVPDKEQARGIPSPG